MSRGNNIGKQAQTLTETKRLSAIESISKIFGTDRKLETTFQLVLDYLVHKLEIADVGIIWIYDFSIDSDFMIGLSPSRLSNLI